MIKKIGQIAIFLIFFISLAASAKGVKGIYVTQASLENSTYLNYLIKQSKRAGINTFVVDMNRPTKKYHTNIQKVINSGIDYVVRIVVFPRGATKAQVRNPRTWQPKLRLMKKAVEWGATEVQLDYIRYNTRQGGSRNNAKEIYNVIKWYRKQLGPNVKLQADVFGIASFGEARHIGQNIPMFAKTINTVCPMVYPSHYEPYDYHYKRPFETIYDSLISIKRQFKFKMPVKLIPWIELSNYHYRMSQSQKIKYIREQISAVREAGADGWYAWSPRNQYDNLFRLLRK